MFVKIPKHTYTIALPSTTSKEVMDWFEVMENNNQLTELLIELVHNSVKSGKYRNAVETTIQAEQPIRESRQVIPQNNFIDSLYDWQDSNSAIFKEVKEEKKEKKRMLSV